MGNDGFKGIVSDLVCRVSDLLPELDSRLKEMGAKDYELEFIPNENSDKDPTVCFVAWGNAMATVIVKKFVRTLIRGC